MFRGHNTEPMNKTVLTYGLIAGLIVTVMMWLTLGSGEHDFDNGLWIGYTTMVVAFSTIFFAVKTFRDKQNEGVITFGKAFRMGLYITLIASTMYVASWMVLSATSDHDYMADYYEHTKAELEASGLPQAEMDAELQKMRDMTALYNNNIAVKIGFTYTEILPVGLLISLLCAGLLKRRSPEMRSGA